MNSSSSKQQLKGEKKQKRELQSEANKDCYFKTNN